MEDTESKFVSAREACAILSVCRSSLYSYIRSGKLRKYESGAPVRTWFERAQIERLRRITAAN